MRALAALVAGLLVGAGLLLSGMTRPAVVLAFLDPAGNWNPALAFTMAGAIAAAAPAFLYVRRRGRSLIGDPVRLADRTRIDLPLLAGAATFGVGWGLSGICPGPGLILLTWPGPGTTAFVAAMAIGMLVAGAWKSAAGTRVPRSLDPAAGRRGSRWAAWRRPSRGD